MTEWFLNGGVMMWPLLVLALGIVVLAGREALALSAAGGTDQPGARSGSLGTILFWGGVSLLLGLLGTVVGIVIMARSIAAAGEVSSALVWGGVGVSLAPLVFGIVIFLLAGFLWLPLHAWHR